MNKSIILFSLIFCSYSFAIDPSLSNKEEQSKFQNKALIQQVNTLENKVKKLEKDNQMTRKVIDELKKEVVRLSQQISNLKQDLKLKNQVGIGQEF